MRAFLLVFALAVAAWTAGTAANAAEVDRIAAVVNDDVVTVHELEMRMRMTMLSSNLPDNPEVQRRVAGQVLRKLIDEQLQLQEAKRLQITVAEEEIAQGIATIEQQNRMPPGSLEQTLRNAGIDPMTSRRQVEAEIAWIKLVRRALIPTLRVSDEEVEDRLERIKGNLGRPEYLLAEIFFAVESPEAEVETRKLAERMFEQLKAGVPFSALARQFSQSATAAAGGNLGWMAADMLDKEVVAAVAEMRPGQATIPIRTSSGYHIVLLRDRRVAGQAAPAAGGVTMNLTQLFLPAPEAAGAEREAARAKAVEVTANAASCADIERIAAELNTPQSGRIGDVRATDIPETLRAVLLTQKVGTATQPLETPDGFRVLMVCDRQGDNVDAGLPPREQVRRELEDERLDIAARRYLRDLRRAAFLDIRV